jgi:hypothetical protein
MRRRELLAYLTGAAVAGTILVLPYTGRAVLNQVVPELHDVWTPFFLLPIVWGIWNWLHVRLHPRLGIAAWGALLGFILGAGANLLLWAEGQWFGAAALLPAYVPVLYYLLWLFVVGPLNEALGVER